MKISEIPDQELLNDLEESQKDVEVCEMALRFEVSHYNEKSVQERLNANKKIIQDIEEEITRRKNI